MQAYYNDILSCIISENLFFNYENYIYIYIYIYIDYVHAGQARPVKVRYTSSVIFTMYRLRYYHSHTFNDNTQFNL